MIRPKYSSLVTSWYVVPGTRRSAASWSKRNSGSTATFTGASTRSKVRPSHTPISRYRGWS